MLLSMKNAIIAKADTLSTADAIALIALLVGILAALVALLQLRRSNQIARSQSWLTLRDLMVNYEDIVANFRPGGEWHKSRTKPHTVEDWSRVETYMGLFEYCR